MTGLRRSAATLFVLALVAALLALVPVARPAQAAPGDVPSTQSIGVPVMLVVDTSGSMADPDPAGTTKIEGAKTALLQLLDALPLGSRIGMRTYPAGAGDCGTGRLDVKVGIRDPSTMSAQVRALQADGGTPTAESLRAAADDLRTAGYQAATIVLVSDGQSTCDPPCEVAQELAASNFDVTVNTVGFQIDAAGASELQCIADATGGTYTDVADSAALGDQLSASQAPSLALDLAYAEQYNPADAATLGITATIRNDSDVLAQDVRASLVFDAGASAGSPTVLQPLRTLGNVAGRGETQVVWDVYPALSSDQQMGQLTFTVTVTSRYVQPVLAQGEVSLQPVTVDQAAPWMSDVDKVVILGDSYSSGEGAQDYREDGTDGCHRSPHTYGERLYAGTDTEVVNLACSGAVVHDYEHEQNDREVAPQRDQLAGVGGYDLVLLTMGGNDVGFSQIIQNCMFGENCDGATRCSNLVAKKLLDCDKAKLNVPDFWQTRLLGLHEDLVDWYREVLEDTGDVPVVVLPYVHVVPEGGVSTGCNGTDSSISKEFAPVELELVQWLQDELDRQISTAVEEVDDPRLLFAGEVGTALQPAHTLCSEQRWVNGLGDRGRNGPLPGSEQQELVHPNADGYAAIARALIRWSTTVDAPPEPEEGGGFLDWPRDLFGQLADAATGLLQGSAEIDLEQPGVTIEVPAGSTVTVETSGYAPGTQVVITVRSLPRALASVVADDEGRVTAEVLVPEDLPLGDHVLVAEGFAEDGAWLVTGQGLQVGHASPWGGVLVAGTGALLLLGGLLVLRSARRVRAQGQVGPHVDAVV